MKKKIISLVLIALFISSIGICAQADGAMLNLEAQGKDEAGNCNVIVELNGAAELAMLQFTLQYDTNRLACAGVEIGSLFDGNIAPTVNTAIDGEINLAWDSLIPLTQDGTALILHMELLGDTPGGLTVVEDDSLVAAKEDFESIYILGSSCTVGDSAIETSKPATTVAPSGTNNGVEISQNKLTTTAGASVTLTTDKTAEAVVWASSDESVATVDEAGNVTANGNGTAIITAMTEDGMEYGSCVITVESDQETAQDSVAEKANYAIPVAAILVVMALIVIVLTVRKSRPENNENKMGDKQ